MKMDMEAYWRNLYETKPAESPLKGVSTGDTVYAYDEDNCAIFEIKVEHASDGCGYGVSSTPKGKRLFPICDTHYGRTPSEVALKHKEEIEATLEYCTSTGKNAQKCLDLIDP